MYGWRGRIGVLIGGGNRVVEAELPRLVPKGVSCHFSRLSYPEISEQGIASMLAGLEDSARLLAGGPNSLEAEVIALAHATASSSRPGADTELIGRIRKTCGVPATTTLTAVTEGLRHLGVHRVSAALPYDKPERSAQLKSFLEGNGFRVEKMKNGPYVAGHEVSSQPPSNAYRLLRDADAPASEAIVMTIPNFRTIEVIQDLEDDLGKPVVTGNQATAWACLGILGIKETIGGFGRLLRA